MELLKQTAGRRLISFGSGMPDPALFPMEAIRAIAAEVLEREGDAALQYGPAEGHPPLREWVADRLRAQGLPGSAENVLITNGSQQGLDLVARLFLDPEKIVVLEDPTYLAALQIFASLETNYDINHVNGEGVEDFTGVARRLRGRPPGLFYTLPNFQNPTGVTMSLERRQLLAETAAEVGVPVLEDDAYHDLGYDSDPPPGIAALAPNSLAVTTGTFSKTIAPGLRVGYLHTSPEIVARLAQLKQLTDLQAGSFTQRIVLEFCLRGYLDRQIPHLQNVYRARRDAMLAALDEHLAGIARWYRPGGGMFLLLWLPEGIDTTALLPQALERGVVYVPGAGFHAMGGGENTMRLNFVTESEERIRDGIALLAEVIRGAV
jgi:2-aminoadipate transaminase